MEGLERVGTVFVMGKSVIGLLASSAAEVCPLHEAVRPSCAYYEHENGLGSKRSDNVALWEDRKE